MQAEALPLPARDYCPHSTISPREILRCAQDDSAGSCHPERSEGSVVRIRLADLTQVALRTYGESLEERHIHEEEFPKRHPSIP